MPGIKPGMTNDGLWNSNTPRMVVLAGNPATEKHHAYSETAGHRRRRSLAGRVNIREHSRAKRRAVRFVIVGQEFVLEFGHVHIGRALGLATLALEAEIERLV